MKWHHLIESTLGFSLNLFGIFKVEIIFQNRIGLRRQKRGDEGGRENGKGMIVERESLHAKELQLSESF